MPLLKQKKHEYDAAAIAEILFEWAENDEPLLTVEAVTRPASLTRCRGLLEGLGRGMGYEVTTVPAQVWKRYFGLSIDKWESIDLAHKLYPSTLKTITKRLDDGLAEALLIARWGKENI